MTETMTLQLDEAVMARLRAVARTHGCEVETLAAQVLDDLLPCAADIAPELDADWNTAAFLDDAAHAFDRIPAGNLRPQCSTAKWDKPLT
ncbi:MAG: hypothetical protein ACREPP_03900 [Rhodanobacteraceae bacterium]